MATKTERVIGMVIPFDADERARWKAANVVVDKGCDPDVLEREHEAFEYFHQVRSAAVATVCEKLGFTRDESSELLRETVAGW